MKWIFLILISINVFSPSYGQRNQNVFYTLEKAFEKPNDVWELDLTNKKINYLPDSINKFTNLEILIISKNNIEVLPNVIGNLSKLKILNVSDNPIKGLPVEITKLSHLKEIDLSNDENLNYTDAFIKLSNLKKLRTLTISFTQSILYSIDTLQQIQKLNIINCAIIEKQCSLYKLRKLRELNISNCKIDDNTKFIDDLKYLKNLKSLSISSKDITEFPESLCELYSLKHLELKISKLHNLPLNFSKLSKLETLSLSDSPVINIDTLFTTIKDMKRLHCLSLQSCNLSTIPNSICNIAAICNLNLSGNNIKMLSSGLNELSRLAYLDLRGNPIDKENYNKIRKQLPHCTVICDVGLEKIGIKPPFKNNIIEPQTFKVKAEQESVLKTNSGTKINIPVNAFVDENGQIVSGDVRIEYQEYNNSVDIFLSGIPMSYKQDGVDYFFNSGGMFSFNAYKNDTKLYANPKSPVTIDLISYNNDKRMNLYHYDEIKQEWDEEDTSNTIIESANIIKPRAPIEPNANDMGLIKPVKDIITEPVKPVFNYSVFNARLYVTFDDNSNNKSFRIAIPNNPPGDKYSKNQYKAFFDVKYLKDYNWVCDDGSITEYQKFKKSIEEKNDIDDIKISEKGSENDYVLSISIGKDSVHINAKPINSDNPSIRSFAYSRACLGFPISQYVIDSSLYACISSSSTSIAVSKSVIDFEYFFSSLKRIALFI
jgi:Leucine-rich repeat (LRR) protein